MKILICVFSPQCIYLCALSWWKRCPEGAKYLLVYFNMRKVWRLNWYIWQQGHVISLFVSAFSFLELVGTVIKEECRGSSSQNLQLFQVVMLFWIALLAWQRYAWTVRGNWWTIRGLFGMFFFLAVVFLSVFDLIKSVLWGGANKRQGRCMWVRFRGEY